ncbi:MAG: PilW family protein, partial [Burkholderiales bacterium]
LMISVVIGMIATILVFQVIGLAEGQKRTIAGGSEAQINGDVALYQLERQIMQAGFGMSQMTGNYYNCDVRGFDNTNGIAVNFSLVPIQIIDGAGGAPDMLDMVLASSAILANPVAFNASTATSKTMASRAGFFIGDVIVAGINPGAPAQCALQQVSGNGGDAFTFMHTGMRFNAAVPPVALGGTGEVLNLGPRPQVVRWAVDPATSRLTMSDLLAASAAPIAIADNVVDLQAQYGYDTTVPADGTVDSWPLNTALPAPFDWQRVVAVRVAILVRSSQYEVVPVTAVAPGWVAAGVSFTMLNLDGSAGAIAPADPTLNWRHYRYRVYEAVVGLRNHVWGKS